MLNFRVRYIANKYATWKNLEFSNRIGTKRTLKILPPAAENDLSRPRLTPRISSPALAGSVVRIWYKVDLSWLKNRIISKNQTTAHAEDGMALLHNFENNRRSINEYFTG